MQTRGNKLLLGFLVFSLLILVVSIFYREDPSVGLSEEKANKENPSTGLGEESVEKKNPPAGLSEDLLQMNPDAMIDHLLGNAEAEEKKKISLESYDLKVERATHWKLPGRLEEISGLAMTTNNRLLAHDDEEAIIHEIDYRNGVIVKTFQLSDMKHPVNDDFEGIATVNDRVYLVTSSGRIYECSRGSDGESVLYNIYSTGVGRDCEIEGLAYDESRRVLLLMCKNARAEDLKEHLVIYHWSIDEKQLNEDAHIVIPVIEFTRYIDEEEFQPSGIEKHPASDNYFVVAARQLAIAEVTPGGQVVGVRQFPDQLHRQPEGITFAEDGALIIADEGVGRKARLTLYPISENR